MATVCLTIWSDDDDTIDESFSFLEAFGVGDLKEFLSKHDPLAKVEVSTDDGFSAWC